MGTKMFQSRKPSLHEMKSYIWQQAADFFYR